MPHGRFFITALLIILMNCGCSDSDGTPGVGYVPKIVAVQSYNENDPDSPEATSVFSVSDAMNFTMIAEDDDLNIKKLWVALYILNEYDAPVDGPYEILLPVQDTAEDMIYSMIFPRTVSEAPGDYIMVFQLEDARGNYSATFGSPFTVE